MAPVGVIAIALEPLRSSDGTIVTAGGRVLADCAAGVFDGFRVDEHGNLWASSAEGIHCLAPDGTLIGKVLVPEVVANVEFGGERFNQLYICGTTSLYTVKVFTNGVNRIS